MPDAASVTVCAALLIVEDAASVTVWAALEIEDVRLPNIPGAASAGGASSVALVPGTAAVSPPLEEPWPVTAFLMAPTSPPTPAAGAGVGSGAPAGAGVGVGAASGCSSPPVPVTCGFQRSKPAERSAVSGISCVGRIVKGINHFSRAFTSVGCRQTVVLCDDVGGGLVCSVAAFRFRTAV